MGKTHSREEPMQPMAGENIYGQETALLNMAQTYFILPDSYKNRLLFQAAVDPCLCLRASNVQVLFSQSKPMEQ